MANYDTITYGLNGLVHYKLDGKLHRLDGPAYECNEYKKWYVNGVAHRDNGPAIEYANGKQVWMQNGQYHRDPHPETGICGPAIENPNNPKENKWYKHGKLHRVDGSASLIEVDAWFIDGEYHREGGPAYKNGLLEQWYVHGKLHRLDGPAYINGNIQCWYMDGKIHRLDGPADIDPISGSWKWYKNGAVHRDVDPITGIAEGPAISNSNSKSWCVNGNLHRIDGPAIEYANGLKVWYINGTKLIEEEFNAYVNPKSDTPHNEVRITRNENGEETCKAYLLNGKLHRVGAPAVEGVGKSEWWTLGVQQPDPNTKKCRVILDGVTHYADKVDIQFI